MGSRLPDRRGRRSFPVELGDIQQQLRERMGIPRFRQLSLCAHEKRKCTLGIRPKGSSRIGQNSRNQSGAPGSLGRRRRLRIEDHGRRLFPPQSRQVGPVVEGGGQGQIESASSGDPLAGAQCLPGRY